ncbi:MAG: PilZ domain-containing protein [Deltaproteobacteria bacterium]|nr:PilZ domain-containing protein [Deltaproteobacteria bacterium]
MSDSQDKREMTRVPLQIDTELRAEGHALITGTTTDISLKGLSVASPRALPTRTACHITLFVGPQEHPIRIALEGTIVRATTQGMAIEITSVPPDSFTHLHNLVIYNAPDATHVDEELSNRVSRRWGQAVKKEPDKNS